LQNKKNVYICGRVRLSKEKSIRQKIKRKEEGGNHDQQEALRIFIHEIIQSENNQ